MGDDTFFHQSPTVIMQSTCSLPGFSSAGASQLLDARADVYLSLGLHRCLRPVLVRPGQLLISLDLRRRSSLSCPLRYRSVAARSSNSFPYCWCIRQDVFSIVDARCVCSRRSTVGCGAVHVVLFLPLSSLLCHTKPQATVWGFSLWLCRIPSRAVYTSTR